MVSACTEGVQHRQAGASTGRMLCLQEPDLQDTGKTGGIPVGLARRDRIASRSLCSQQSACERDRRYADEREAQERPCAFFAEVEPFTGERACAAYSFAGRRPFGGAFFAVVRGFALFCYRRSVRSDSAAFAAAIALSLVSYHPAGGTFSAVDQ